MTPLRLSNEKEKFMYMGAPDTINSIGYAYIPYAMTLSWLPRYNIKKFSCHNRIIPHVQAIFQQLNKIDPETLKAAGFNIFGGCHEVRPTRSNKRRWSAHAFGMAIDIDPKRNGLFTSAEYANLAKPEFDFIHDIWYQYGFINLGDIIGRDFMHYEASYELISNPERFLK